MCQIKGHLVNTYNCLHSLFTAQNVLKCISKVLVEKGSRRIRKLEGLLEFVEMPEPPLNSRLFRIACTTLTLQ